MSQQSRVVSSMTCTIATCFAEHEAASLGTVVGYVIAVKIRLRLKIAV